MRNQPTPAPAIDRYFQTRDADTGELCIVDRTTTEIVLQGETYQITANVLEALNEPDRAWGECGEIADAIRATAGLVRVPPDEPPACYDDVPQDTRDLA